VGISLGRESSSSSFSPLLFPRHWFLFLEEEEGVIIKDEAVALEKEAVPFI
jgi:hypothetical protein